MTSLKCILHLLETAVQSDSGGPIVDKTDFYPN